MGTAAAQRSNEALLADFLRYSAQSKSHTTVYIYGRDLGHYLEYIGNKPLASISPMTMRDWAWQPNMLNGADTSDATKKRKVMQLRSLYKFLHEIAEVAERNPAAKLDYPKDDEPGEARSVPDHQWMPVWLDEDLSLDVRVAIGLAYFCGLRRHEVTLLTPDQFRGQHIYNMKRKGKKKTRPFPWRSCAKLYEQIQDQDGRYILRHLIGEAASFTDAVDELVAQRRGRRALLPWGDRWGLRQSNAVPEGVTDPNRFNARLRALGLPFTPHQLRHSFGTNLVRADIHPMRIAELMGHADPRITMIYTKSDNDPLSDYLTEDDEGEK